MRERECHAYGKLIGTPIDKRLLVIELFRCSKERGARTAQEIALRDRLLFQVADDAEVDDNCFGII